MTSEDEYVPAGSGDSEDRYLRGAGASSDDETSDSTSGDEGGTFFDTLVDPLALLENMEKSATDPFELLRRRRRRSRRLAGHSRSEEDEDDEDEDDALEEAQEAAEGIDEEEQDESSSSGDSSRSSSSSSDSEEEAADVEMQEADVPARTRQGAAPPAPTAGDGRRRANKKGDHLPDDWSDDLAEKLGMAPAMNRKKAKNREKWRRTARARRGNGQPDVSEAAINMLGQANLLYANQSHHEAIALLLEVVRVAPSLPDPYHTLGLLHEAVGNGKKALDFYMIAAHITPRDVALWKRLASMSSEFGLVRQAVYCLGQVVRRDREDLVARYDRALLYAELDDNRKAIDGLEQVRAARPEHPELPKQLARLYYRTGQHAKAVSALREFTASHPDATDLTHINLLAELLCSPEVADWRGVLTLLDSTRQELLAEGEEVPVDLRVKAAVATAHLGDIQTAVTELAPLLAEPVETFGDLYHDAAAAMEALGQHEAAEPFLRALADDPGAGPEVWRRLAHCCKAAGRPGGAVAVWEQYTSHLDPYHPGQLDALVALADALREQGDDAGAAAALGRLQASMVAPPPLPLSSDLAEMAAAGTLPVPPTEAELLQKAAVLKACGRADLLADLALSALTATLRAYRAPSVAPTDDFALTRNKTRLGGRGRRASRGGGSTREDAVFVGYQADRRRRVKPAPQPSGQAAPAPVEELPAHPEAAVPLTAALLPGLLREEAPFQLLVDTALSLLADGRAGEARRLVQEAVETLGNRWSNRQKRDVMRLLLVEAALREGNLTAALGNVRPPGTRWPSSPIVWNAFSRFLKATGGGRQTTKFLSPLRTRNPASVPLALLSGHALMQTGAYVAALGEYFQAYCSAPEEPLVLLCIAVALVNQAASRHVPDRHVAVLQAFGFLQEYGARRRDPAEAAYNAGRAAQQLLLHHVAAPLYEGALAAAAEARASIDGGTSSGSASIGAAQEAAGAYDVSPEAAFNLALIYKSSGAAQLASQVMRQHLTF